MLSGFIEREREEGSGALRFEGSGEGLFCLT